MRTVTTVQRNLKNETPLLLAQRTRPATATYHRTRTLIRQPGHAAGRHRGSPRPARRRAAGRRDAGRPYRGHAAHPVGTEHGRERPKNHCQWRTQRGESARRHHAGSRHARHESGRHGIRRPQLAGRGELGHGRQRQGAEPGRERRWPDAVPGGHGGPRHADAHALGGRHGARHRGHAQPRRRAECAGSGPRPDSGAEAGTGAAPRWPRRDGQGRNRDQLTHTGPEYRA